MQGLEASSFQALQGTDSTEPQKAEHPAETKLLQLFLDPCSAPKGTLCNRKCKPEVQGLVGADIREFTLLSPCSGHLSSCCCGNQWKTLAETFPQVTHHFRPLLASIFSCSILQAKLPCILEVGLIESCGQARSHLSRLLVNKARLWESQSLLCAASRSCFSLTRATRCSQEALAACLLGAELAKPMQAA